MMLDAAELIIFYYRLRIFPPFLPSFSSGGIKEFLETFIYPSYVRVMNSFFGCKFVEQYVHANGYGHMGLRC